MRQAHGARPGAKPSSFIRTVTVGSGIRPDLLTLRCTGGARGLAWAVVDSDLAYRRWGIAPRPEDVLHVVLTTSAIVRLSARMAELVGRDVNADFQGTDLSAWADLVAGFFAVFFFGSASIVPRHGGVPHRQR
jgi:hypothetical protein